jgi:hypothetical protein
MHRARFLPISISRFWNTTRRKGAGQVFDPAERQNDGAASCETDVKDVKRKADDPLKGRRYDLIAWSQGPNFRAVRAGTGSVWESPNY